MRCCRSRVTALMVLVLATIAIPMLVEAQCDPQPQLVGAWEWQGAWGPPAFPSFTPESEGRTLQLEFMESGALLHYENEVLVRESSWQPPTCESYPSFGCDPCWIVEADSIEFVDDHDIPVQVWFDEEQLVLMASYPDALVCTYVARAPIPVNRSSWGRLKQLYR